MATLIRTSGNLTRLATRPRANICGLCIWRLEASSVHSQNVRARAYATNPKEPKEPDESQKGRAKKKAAKSRPRIKPAPGFEQLYGTGSPLWFQSTKEDGSGKQRQNLPPNRSMLSEQETERLNNLLQTLKKGLPAKEYKKVEEVFQTFKKIGVPKEFRDIMTKIENGAPIDISTAAKLVRITQKILRDVREKQIENEEGKDKSTSSKTPFSSEEKSSSDEQKQKRQSHSNGPKGFTMQFDASTFAMGCLGGYMIYKLLSPGENSKEISFQEFKTAFLDRGLVTGLILF